MEGEQKTAPNLSNGTGLNDLEWPLTQFQGHDIIQRQRTRKKWYNVELCL